MGVKILIPPEKRTEYREYEIEEGEIVLLRRNVASRRIKFDDPEKVIPENQVAHFGVFGGKEEYRPTPQGTGLVLRRPVILRPAYNIGEVDVPIIQELRDDPHLYKNLSTISGISIGQDKIIDTLRSWEGLELHIDWISKLKKPYIQ